MPLYQWACEKCGKTEDGFRPVAERHDSPLCHGKRMGIVGAEYERGDLFRGEPEGSEIYDILDCRQLRGITQALVDWEVVRLVASTLGIDLGSGQLFVIDTND